MYGIRRPLALALLAAACASPKPREVVHVIDPHEPAYLAPGPASAKCGEPGSTTPPAAVVQISATWAASCARLEDGSVWCWGTRDQTLIDNDVLGSVACPVATRVPELSPAKDLRGTCVVREDGTARCGNLSTWRFEDVDAATLVDPPEVIDYGGSCALESGTVRCRNGLRSHVLATEIAAMTMSRNGLVVVRDDHTLWRLRYCGGEICETRDAEIGSPVVAFDRADEQRDTCLLAADGRVWCDTACTTRDCTESTFAAVAGVDDATQIAVGMDHACALRQGGTIVCWGESHCGEAGGNVVPGEACARTRVQVPPTAIAWAK
jgi:hypothetical protein